MSGLANLPLLLDVIAVATASPATTTQVIQHLARVFGTFASWRVLADLQDAGIIIVRPDTRHVVWTPFGRKFHADIEKTMATVQDVEGSS